jgi:hypothetical protein
MINSYRLYGLDVCGVSNLHSSMCLLNVIAFAIQSLDVAVQSPQLGLIGIFQLNSVLVDALRLIDFGVRCRFHGVRSTLFAHGVGSDLLCLTQLVDRITVLGLDLSRTTLSNQVKMNKSKRQF